MPQPNRARTRAGIAASLLVAAAVLALAVLAPAWWAPLPGPREPVPSAPAVDPAGARQAALIDDLDARLRDVVRDVPWNSGPYLDRAHGEPVLVLPRRPARYVLDDLVRGGAARWAAPTVLTVTADVLAAPGAVLDLRAPGTEIRLAGGGPRTITAWRADLLLHGAPGAPVRVTTRGERGGDVDRDPADGRGHLRVAGGLLDVGDAELTGLGFWSGRTGGLAVTGVAGERGRAVVRDTTVTDGWYGLYADDAAVTVEDARFERAGADAVRLHRGVRDAALRRVSAGPAAGVGIAVGRGASAVTLTDVTTGANAVGVLVDGNPLADRPGPAGDATTGFAGFTVQRLVSRGDRAAGIVVDGAAGFRLDGADVRGSRDGVVLRGPTRDAVLAGARVADAGEAGIAVRDGVRAARIDGAVVTGAMTGIRVRDASVVLRDPVVTGATRHGVAVSGAAAGTSVLGGRVAGTGSAAVDLARLAPGTAVDVRGTDVAGWTVRRDVATVVGATAGNPMLLVWVLIALVPLLAVWVQRRRAAGRAPVPYPGRSGAPAAQVPVRVSVRVPGGPRLTVVDPA